VMREGVLRGELRAETATEDDVMQLAAHQSESVTEVVA
jgi:hypothetical protein